MVGRTRLPKAIAALLAFKLTHYPLKVGLWAASAGVPSIVCFHAMPIDSVVAISCGAAFLAGLLVHRWWVVAPIALVWVIFIGLSLARPGLTADAQNTNFAAFVVLEVPTVLAGMVGVALGRALRRTPGSS